MANTILNFNYAISKDGNNKYKLTNNTNNNLSFVSRNNQICFQIHTNSQKQIKVVKHTVFKAKKNIDI